MPSFIRSTTHWVGRHTLPAAVATVLVVGAAGGGVGYSIASGHASAAPLSTTAPATQPATKGHRGAAGRGDALISRALGMLSTETGQSVASIRAQLAAGKSIDQIAGAKAPAIEAKILAVLATFGDHAVKAGKISATQETMYLAMAKTKVEALMAEPGTQLIKDVQGFLHMLQLHGGRHAAAGTAPAASPAA